MRTLLIALVLVVATVPALAVGGYGVVDTVGAGADAVTVLYTGGTPYDIGWWHGHLLRDKVQYMDTVVLPLARADAGAGALAAAWQQMAPFIPDEFTQELQGLADGSGVPLSDLQEMQAIGDVSEYHCSNFAAFGAATAGAHALQMRILDWSMDLRVQDQPLITVAEPLGRGLRYANVGFVAQIGSIAGMNSAGIGIGEMGDDFDYAYETLAGLPLTYLMRGVISDTTNFTDALAYMQNASRTSSLWYMLMDANAPQSALLQTSPITFNYWPAGSEPTGFPVLADVSYGGHYNDRLYADLSANYGFIDPTVAQAIARHNAMGGNLLDTVYDLTTKEIWFAYAADGVTPASTQPFVYLNVMAFQAPPYVTGVAPSGGATGVDPAAVPQAIFSADLDVSTVGGATVGLTGPAGAVAGTVSYDAAAKAVTFTPGAALPNGSCTVTLKGGDTGLKGANGVLMQADYTWDFTVADAAAPTVLITAPSEGATVSGSVPIAATATDNVAVARVDFAVDGAAVGSDSTAPYEATWASSGNGSHTITAMAVDVNGLTSSNTINVTTANPTFDDVPATSAYYPYVEAVNREGIVTGCTATSFCPTGTSTKAEMAVYLCRAKGLAPYDKATPTFVDVPKTMPQYAYVEAAYQAGIMPKCSSTKNKVYFCPTSVVTRAEMALYLCKATATPQYKPRVATFSDVAKTSTYYPWIEAAYRAGFITPCATSPLRYCPSANLTRADLAVFLCNAFGIPR